MKFKALKGVQDILPGEIDKWEYLEDCAKEQFSLYGFNQIKIPVIEETGLFVRSIGQQTDIVEKEMYSFVDRGKREISLRPEATASVVRAYLEHNLTQLGVAKLYYIGPMFRGEKPQSGRNRQFYQMGIEALGSYDPYFDAEVITLAVEYLTEIGIKNFDLVLNTVGCSHDKAAYAKLLKTYLKTEEKSLCENCQNRLERNVLRVLDCKNPNCKKVIHSAPIINDHLCSECNDHFKSVKQYLDLSGIAYNLSPYLVRGLDYYTKTVFEITHQGLGSQNAICAGGRYDNLIKDMGGLAQGATGFAFGIERLLLAASAEEIVFPIQKKTVIYAIGLGEDNCKELFKIVAVLRRKKNCVINGFEQKSLKAHMKQSHKLGSDITLILGEEEFKDNCILIRDMQSGEQEKVKLNEVVAILEKKIKNKV
ncbi:MAG: histidine--tRNA ligase [Candidatus Omnitrophota bacterium]